MNTINGLRVTMTTLIGSSGKFPRQHGNCFSMATDDGGKEYRIVNFIEENLTEAVRRGVSYPIKLHPISENKAIVFDERIPDKWYSDHYCECCCPFELLPINQQMKHLRARARKEEEIIHCEGNEYCNIPMDIVKTDPSKAPDLRTEEEKAKDKEGRDSLFKGWKIVEEVGVSIVNDLAVLKDKVKNKGEKATRKWLPLVHKKKGKTK